MGIITKMKKTWTKVTKNFFKKEIEIRNKINNSKKGINIHNSSNNLSM